MHTTGDGHAGYLLVSCIWPYTYTYASKREIMHIKLQKSAKHSQWQRTEAFIGGVGVCQGDATFQGTNWAVCLWLKATFRTEYWEQEAYGSLRSYGSSKIYSVSTKTQLLLL